MNPQFYDENKHRVHDKKNEVTITFFDNEVIGIWISKFDQPTAYRLDVDLSAGTFDFKKFE
jgi:hypothetical protein